MWSVEPMQTATQGQRSKVTERIRSQRGSYTRFGGVRHGSRCRWRRRVLSGGLGQRTCLRFQALAKAVPEAYQLLYPKGLQRLAALRERDCCGHAIGLAAQMQRMKAGTCRQQTTEGVHSELAVERGVEWLVAGLVAGRAVVGWEEEGTVAADGVEEELAAVGWLVVGLEVAGRVVMGWEEEEETVAVGGEQEEMAAVGWLVAGLEVAVREARERPKSPIDAATWLRHFVNLQLKRTFQPTASLKATSNPATSHPTAAIRSCPPPTATVSPSSSHPTTAVPATSNPTTSRPTTASSSSTPSAATPTTALPATNPATSLSTPRSTASSELDSDISVADVHAALDKLSSSSACLGPLKAVLIKAGRDALTPVLAALFNAVFRSGCFPPEWSLGAITPIHKKGDTADPNNYRGITVGHILGKLYALAINTRLNTWLETQGLRARGQAGFRQGYRTVDNCFILRALAERARSRGVKLYLCAVDFEKAFDSVDRPLLWAALQRAGIGGTMLQAIQAMYADVPVCVRTEEGLSGCFQSVLGVKQGCPLSPLLFGIFLDDFEGHIQQLGDAAALPQLAGRTVPPLLFADDMFLLSSSASGLQAQLHALQDYCNAKKLTVNAKKTQVMIMRPGGGSGNGKLAAGESFAYAGLPLEVASSTKYLGLTFSQLSKQHGFASCADVLAKAGRQAMFAMRRRAWELGACLVEQQCMLFDVFVKPVLSYGCELWGVDVLLRPDCSSVERVHRWFCRRVQGLPKQVTAAISLAEGRQPLQSFWIQQLVRFWNRLQNSAADEDRVLGWAFKDNLELMREGGDLAAGSACWSRRWLHVLQSAPPASGTLEWLTELDEAAKVKGQRLQSGFGASEAHTRVSAACVPSQVPGTEDTSAAQDPRSRPATASGILHQQIRLLHASHSSQSPSLPACTSLV
ncbi:LINE-1 retrotransposable element ORF2 protein [Chlorella vulgaris]